MLSPQLMEILACPKCKTRFGALSPEGDLVCKHCRLRYPVREGIPVLLLEEARPLDAADPA